MGPVPQALRRSAEPARDDDWVGDLSLVAGVLRFPPLRAGDQPREPLCDLGPPLADAGPVPKPRLRSPLAGGFGGHRPHRHILGATVIALAPRLPPLQRSAHLTLLALVGVEPPELCPGHRLGERRVRTRAASPPPHARIARMGELDVRRCTSDAWLEPADQRAAPTRAQAFARVGIARVQAVGATGLAWVSPRCEGCLFTPGPGVAGRRLSAHAAWQFDGARSLVWPCCIGRPFRL